MGLGMCFLGMQPAHPTEIGTRLLQPHVIESPLGRIILAGTIRDFVGRGEKRRRLLGNYALVYLLAGRGRYRDDRGADHPLSAGDFILLFPDIAHRYGPLPGEHWDEIYVVFDGPVFDLWRKQGLLDPSEPVFSLSPIDYWFQQFTAAVMGEAGGNPTGGLHAVMRLQGFLAALLQARQSTSSPGWLAQACIHLGRIESPDWNVLARLSGLSYEAFRKKFVRLTGTSPLRYHLAKLIDRACLLLQQTDRPHKEIAETLGFSDEFHFSKTFKGRTGLSPSVFRQQSKGHR